MSITFANVPLSTEDPGGKLAALLAEWWHRTDIRDFDHPGYHVAYIDHLPIPPAPKRTCPQLGVLVWPTGASRWAEFSALVTGDQLAAITVAVGADSPSARTFQLNDGTTTISPQLWMLAPRYVCRESSKDLYLLTLVDVRWRWWLKVAASPSAPVSWSDLITSYLTSVGESASLPSIPAAYGTPDADRWDVGYKPIPLLLDAVCATVGLRLTRTTTGMVSVSTAATAITAEEARWTANQAECLTGGRVSVAQLAISVPATVRVVFPAVTPATSDKTLATLALTEYGSATGMPGAVAYVGADRSTSDASYTTQAATDYYKWSLSRIDAAFRGVRNYVPTGLEDRIEWVHQTGSHPGEPDCEDVPRAKVLTRIFRRPDSDRNVYGDLNVAQKAASTSSTAECDDRGWLQRTIPTTKALKLVSMEVHGTCADGVTVPDLVADPHYFLWDSVAMNWQLTRNLTLGCGCGSLVLTQDAANMAMNGTFTGTGDGSCTVTFKTGCGRDGYVQLVGYSAVACPDPENAADEVCTNVIRLGIECVPCGLENVVCTKCLEGEAPPILKIPASGFSGANEVYNGTWYLPATTACTYSVTCGDVTVTAVVACTTITITFSGGGGGGATYVYTAAGGVACFQGHTADRTAGDAGTTPASLTTTPIYCGTACPLTSMNITMPAHCGSTALTDQAMANNYGSAVADYTEGPGDGTCPSFGVGIRCQGNGKFTVFPICNIDACPSSGTVCYAGGPITTDLENEATLPDVQVTFSWVIDCCGVPETKTIVLKNF